MMMIIDSLFIKISTSLIIESIKIFRYWITVTLLSYLCFFCFIFSYSSHCHQISRSTNTLIFIYFIFYLSSLYWYSQFIKTSTLFLFWIHHYFITSSYLSSNSLSWLVRALYMQRSYIFWIKISLTSSLFTHSNLTHFQYSTPF